MTTDLDVAIIGAGPAGLAVALGLQRVLPGVRLKVYDRASSLRPLGAAITVAVNGQCALEAISGSALQAVRDKALTVRGWQSRNHLGGIMRSGVVRAPPPPAGQAVSASSVVNPTPLILSWFSLQEALLNVLGAHHLVLNKAVTHVQQEEGGQVTLTFQDGSQTTARVVVGADGNMSATRAALFPEEGPPEYIGGATWRTMISPVPAALELPIGWLAMWHSEDGARRLGIRNFGDHLSVTGLAPWPRERLQELWRGSHHSKESHTHAVTRQEDKRKRLAEALSSALPDDVVSLLLNTDPNTLIEHGMWWRDPEKAWVRGSVALVGDAAHVLPPIVGQGTSLAFEDAAWLVMKLSSALTIEAQASRTSALAVLRGPGSAGLIHTTLKAYQAQQQPRVSLISRHALRSERTTTQALLNSQAHTREQQASRVLGGLPLTEYIKRAGPFTALAHPDVTRRDKVALVAKL